MVEKTITRLKRERDQAAIRAARYRERRAKRPDVRAVDKSLSEAIAVYSRTLPPAASTAFVKTMVRLAAAGLELKGYGANSSTTRTAKRLQTWTSSVPHSGSVRAAVAQDLAAPVRDAITVA